ncbi:porin [Methylophaga sp. OBS4]|uniref:porin n=1 Tax=Methylophaga sp. OBS4 TaxID=2991935 RepID=UPI0022542C64|nr:porin [Methylophaga sp. OBS4]MCX4187422.1 porin [Methylophaga sp. OBS4]
MKFKRTLLATTLMTAMAAAQAASPSNEEIWQMLQEMKQQLNEVKEQNQELKAENQNLKQKVEETEVTAREASEAAEAMAVATEEAVKAVASKDSKTSIGGYGELHYNNLENQGDADDKDEIDFHRFVLFFNHEFNDRLRFFSELELEHSLAGEGKNGEVEIEQAFIQYDLNDRHRVNAGLFLMPVGLLNETHEPPTFYGVERNNVEKNIIPTTWWEGGAMLSGEIAQGFSYDVAATSGLNTNSGKKYAVRNGRQKVSNAEAEDFAYTARLKWTGMPGVELSTSLQYQEDITQSNDPDAGSATLWEAHAAIQKGNFGLRALYATWDLDGDGPESVGADEQTGWYIEPSYKLTDSIGIFTRYSMWDNQAGNSTDTEFNQWDIGLNWWIDPQVVVKVDYQDMDADNKDKEFDGFNVGLGYQF